MLLYIVYKMNELKIIDLKTYDVEIVEIKTRDVDVKSQ